METIIVIKQVNHRRGIDTLEMEIQEIKYSISEQRTSLVGFTAEEQNMGLYI